MLVSAAEATIAAFRSLHPRPRLASAIRLPNDLSPSSSRSHFQNTTIRCVAHNPLPAEAPVHNAVPSVHSSLHRGHSERALAAPRNPVGVQLLAPYLHSQVFPNTAPASAPPLDPLAVSLSLAHLSSHGLSPAQASVLTPTHMTLPPLQGANLDEHFWSLGRKVAQPWLGYAHELAAASIPDAPEDAMSRSDKSQDAIPPQDWLALPPTLRKELHPQLPKWAIRSGWTRYALRRSIDEHDVPRSDMALCEGEPINFPPIEEPALVFDVETMVNAGPFPVMATAVSSKAWYAWISPWLLGESDTMEHLIPFGSQTSSNPRLIVGHNVSYDRARVLDEYNLSRSSIRWLDTMSLHVATRGISSPQRPAWAKHSKARATKRAEMLLEKSEMEESTREAIKAALQGLEFDEAVLEGLDLEALGVNAENERRTIEPSPRRNSAGNVAIADVSGLDPDAASVLWQDVTSANSLAEVAALHCGLRLPKEMRNIFVEATDRSEIQERLPELLSYCARDTATTHAVFGSVFPAFVSACPHPATLAGVFGLGSAILPIDDEWQEYWTRSEKKYEAARVEVRKSLVEIAERLRSDATAGVSWTDAERAAKRWADRVVDSNESSSLIGSMSWENDPWTSQLDWTPKKPKRLRGSAAETAATTHPSDKAVTISTRRVPKWYHAAFLKSAKKVEHPLGPRSNVAPLLLQLCWDEQRFRRDATGTWRTATFSADGSPLRKSFASGSDAALRLSCAPTAPVEAAAALDAIKNGAEDMIVRELLTQAAEALLLQRGSSFEELGPHQSEDGLDWTAVDVNVGSSAIGTHTSGKIASKDSGYDGPWWPKWYWDLFDSSTAELQLTIRTRIAPLLLKVEWRGCPLFHSREFGWTYRTLCTPGDIKPASPKAVRTTKRTSALVFKHEADALLRSQAESGRYAFFKVPHTSGDSANVGSPFSKSFLPFFENGTLASEHPDDAGKAAAKAALDMNAQCSYWIGVRDRIKGQMVVYDGTAGAVMGFAEGASGARDTEQDMARRKGIILPQVVTMGTVTRRAIEKTWLTAANSKKNRLGSELKTMVKAPPGWRIVGADVDSEELWICSVMGDAQFGFHGATAVGWMTLEGTKAQGTDLHSKTAAILGTSRNAAKVFNYSRIYGAGINHAKQLLLKADPSMSEEEAKRRAKDLYAATKGITTPNVDAFGRRFWYGGSESFVFNKLEAVATSDQPTTPALDCGVTAALSRKYLPKKVWEDGQRSEDYMPSRINWVVQSSGVDYLHLLVVAMDYLCLRYDINARFMLSVHDEVRYLAREEDSLRAALALQIANLWTRAMFSHKLEMNNLPEGVAWFAAVDLDRVLRKEVDDPCITPSSPVPIPSGEALEIASILERTNGGSLHADGRPMEVWDAKQLPSLHIEEAHVAAPSSPVDSLFPLYKRADQSHRSRGMRGLHFLQAQAASDIHEVRALARRAAKAVEGGSQSRKARGLDDISSASGSQNIPFEFSTKASAKRYYTTTSHRSRQGVQAVGIRIRNARVSGPTTMSGFLPRVSRRIDLGTSSSVKQSQAVTNLQIRQQRSMQRNYVTASTLTTPRTANWTGASVGSLGLSESTQRLLGFLPPRPIRSRIPYLRSSEHRSSVLWGFWRPFLRATKRLKNREDEDLWIEHVRDEIRRTRNSCSRNQVERLMQRGVRLARCIEDAVSGNAGAKEALARKTASLKAKRSRIEELNSFRAQEAIRNRPRSFPSGGLLRPTLFNAPCPRYKPHQPVKLSMMIYYRRRRREARQERQADIKELLRDIDAEARFEVAVTGSTKGIFAGDVMAWKSPFINVLTEISECYARDARRAAMVFDRKLLLQAKQARRRRHSIRVANAARRSQDSVPHNLTAR